MMLDPIGECDECGDVAYIENDHQYCLRHSSLLNDVDPETVVEIYRNVLDLVSDAEIQPLGFIGCVVDGDEIAWEVHELVDDYDYRVSEKDDFVNSGQFVIEPTEPRYLYTDLEDFL